MALNHFAAIGCMVGMVALPVRESIACLFFFYEAMMGLAAPGTFAIAQTMAGPSASAISVGVQNMCGNLAGICAPAITGFLVNATGRFETAFWLAGIVNVLGILGRVFILPKIVPLRWTGDAIPSEVGV